MTKSTIQLTLIPLDLTHYKTIIKSLEKNYKMLAQEELELQIKYAKYLMFDDLPPNLLDCFL